MQELKAARARDIPGGISTQLGHIYIAYMHEAHRSAAMCEITRITALWATSNNPQGKRHRRRQRRASPARARVCVYIGIYIYRTAWGKFYEL